MLNENTAPRLEKLLDRLATVAPELCGKSGDWHTFSKGVGGYWEFRINVKEQPIDDYCDVTDALDDLAKLLRRQFRSRRLPLTIELTPESLAFITTCHDPKTYPLEPVKTNGEHEAIALLEALVIVLEAATAKEAA